jgi:hypothetical protein
LIPQVVVMYVVVGLRILHFRPKPSSSSTLRDMRAFERCCRPVCVLSLISSSQGDGSCAGTASRRDGSFAGLTSPGDLSVPSITRLRFEVRAPDKDNNSSTREASRAESRLLWQVTGGSKSDVVVRLGVELDAADVCLRLSQNAVHTGITKPVCFHARALLQH